MFFFFVFFFFLFLSSLLVSHRQISGFKQMRGTEKKEQSVKGANVQEEGWEWKYIRVACGRCRCVLEENVLSVLVFSSQSYFKQRALRACDAYSRINITHLLQAEMKGRGLWGSDKQRKICLLGYTLPCFSSLIPTWVFFFFSLFITSSHSTWRACLW